MPRSLLTCPIELCMECVDDELSPWQLDANVRAESEYNDALQRVEEERAVAPPPQATMRSVGAIRNTPVERESSPDVIILDELSSSSSASNTSLPAIQRARTRQSGADPSMQAMQSTLHVNIYPRNVAKIPVQRVQGQQRQPSTASSATTMQRRSATKVTAESERTIDDDAEKSPAVMEDKEGSWVPLDEYYYGKKEGDPSFVEEKGEHRFKCCFCQKMLYNNLRLMLHLQGHIDSEKQLNLQLSDITQCKHCYRQFDTPFEMQCHVEKIHQNKSNVLVCRICEKEHSSAVVLRQHMKATHSACEMPYICQLCDFRSSIYSDVVDHFKKRHDGSGFLLCLYCLRVIKVHFSKAHGWAMTHIFFQHLQKHQVKSCQKKCSYCKLTFLNKRDMQMHYKDDHKPNCKGIRGLRSSSTTVTANRKTVMIQLPDQHDLASGAAGTQQQQKSLNAPSGSAMLEVRGLTMCGISASLHMCIECSAPMNSRFHYRKYIECSMCRYATICSAAYASHMMSYHSGATSKARWHRVPHEAPLGQPLYCLCGYTAKFGSSLANHLISCSKTTCYATKPKPKWIEYDDQREDSSSQGPGCENVPTLFGALGLVKKKPGVASRKGKRHSTSVVQSEQTSPPPAGSSSPLRTWLLPKKDGVKVSIMASVHKKVKAETEANTTTNTKDKVSVEGDKPTTDDVTNKDSAMKTGGDVTVDTNTDGDVTTEVTEMEAEVTETEAEKMEVDDDVTTTTSDNVTTIATTDDVGTANENEAPNSQDCPDISSSAATPMDETEPTEVTEPAIVTGTGTMEDVTNENETPNSQGCPVNEPTSVTVEEADPINVAALGTTTEDGSVVVVNASEHTTAAAEGDQQENTTAVLE